MFAVENIFQEVSFRHNTCLTMHFVHVIQGSWAWFMCNLDNTSEALLGVVHALEDREINALLKSNLNIVIMHFCYCVRNSISSIKTWEIKIVQSQHLEIENVIKL